MSVVVREAELSDAHGVARVEIDAWRDTYPTLLPSAHLVGGLDMARRTVFWRHRLSNRSALRTVVGAVNSRGPIVGYATWGPCRVDTLASGGQLFELYLLPDHQGRGLGRRLCAAVGECFLKAGVSSMCVEVLEGNPNRFFYEAIGGRLAARARHPFAGTILPTLIYAWDNLELLVGERAR